MLKRTLIFLILNFSALAIGGLFTGDGVASEWYYNLNKAPWTPPGWVFGFAWSTIMICFSFFMSFLWNPATKAIKWLYILQWVFNVLWNPLFFYFNMSDLALINIVSLLVIVSILQFKYYSQLKLKSLLIAPYFIWLIIACSLNAYICLYN